MVDDLLPGRPAENINNTCTVGELITRLVQMPPDVKVHIRVPLTAFQANVEEGTVGLIWAQAPLICALEIEDIHYEPDETLVARCMLLTGHEAINEAFGLPTD